MGNSTFFYIYFADYPGPAGSEFRRRWAQPESTLSLKHYSLFLTVRSQPLKNHAGLRAYRLSTMHSRRVPTARNEHGHLFLIFPNFAPVWQTLSLKLIRETLI
jgi:hypothetical protein